MSVKKALRKELLSKRSSITDKSVKDAEIISRLLGLDCYNRADKVLIYVSLRDEIDTEHVINSALSDGKTVAVPYCVNKEGMMDFYAIHSLDELKTSTFGVREPDVNLHKKLEDFENSIIIVPGLSFDRTGYRIGYGGGYYDRFLSEYNYTSIGLCYDEVLCNHIPRDTYDLPVDIVITEKDTFMISGGKNGF